jgi:hypothetical protein
MRAMHRLASVIGLQLLVFGLLFGDASAQSARPEPRRGGAMLVREMLTVTGTLRLVPEPGGEGSALEIDAGNLGRFRITELGLGAELKHHADEQVSIVAFVEPFQQDGHPVLRVAGFTLHDRRA